MLQDYSYLANLRELENMVERAVLMARGGIILPEHFVGAIKGRPHPGEKQVETDLLSLPFDKAIAELEKRLIEKAIREAKNNKNGCRQPSPDQSSFTLQEDGRAQNRGVKADPPDEHVSLLFSSLTRNLKPAIRISVSRYLDRDIAKPLLRPAERPAPMPLAKRKEFLYRNGNSGYKEEAHMTISLTVLPGRLVFLGTISLSLLVGVPRTAGQTPSGSSQEQVKVVAHLPLEGMHVNQMFVLQRDSKFYLYLHRPVKDAFALVDVTKPDKPVLLSRDALKETPGSQVQPPAGSSVLILTVTPEGGAAHAAPATVQLPTETVQFVDMSNPKSAKSVKTFKGVTSVYPDDARKLVYLVNEEGLWIVSHRMNRPMPLCTSEEALTPLPDCR